MHQNKVKSILGLVGFAYRARAINCGCDLSCDGVRDAKAKIVLYASDASRNTIKRISNCCQHYKCNLYELSCTCQELGKVCGNKASISVVAILDDNLAKGIIKHIMSEDVSI